MTTIITAPKAPIPIGVITINGVRYEVAQHPEFVRFFFDLMRRVGGTQAPSNTDLQNSVEAAQSAEMVMQPSAPHALAAETMQTPEVGLTLPDVMQAAGCDVFGIETTWQN